MLSPHNVGLSVLLLPGFAVDGLVGAQVQLVLTAALTWALAFVLALRLTGARPWLVWLATVAVAFSATGFIYSSEVYPEMPAGLVLVGALLLSTGGEQPGVGDRVYRLWGLLIDRRFGVARWAPVLFVVVPGMVLLTRGDARLRLVLGLVVVQLLIATFVAVTMMGWWFAGRTLVTVFPLLPIPFALVAARAGRPSRAVLARPLLARRDGGAGAGRAIARGRDRGRPIRDAGRGLPRRRWALPAVHGVDGGELAAHGRVAGARWARAGGVGHPRRAARDHPTQPAEGARSGGRSSGQSERRQRLAVDLGDGG